MPSFTAPLLAVVVNLVIVLVGWRALTALPVRQYLKIESSSADHNDLRRRRGNRSRVSGHANRARRGGDQRHCFTSTERDVPAITDWLPRTLPPQLSTLPGVQRASFEDGRQLAIRVWIDPDRPAAVNLSPLMEVPSPA